MKITGVDIYHVCKIKPPLPNWYPVCVEIQTDEGVTGWGETGIPVMTGHESMPKLIEEIAPMIIGMDPLDTDLIWDKLYKDCYWSYSGGAISFAAISTLDVALWDIKGKVANLPLYKLLGGRYNENLRSYASQIQLGWGKNPYVPITPEGYAEQAMNAVADGFDAIKVDPFWTDENGLICNPQRSWFPKEKCTPWDWKQFVRRDHVKMVSDRVAAIREAVGDNVDIIIEMHGMLDVNTSIQIGRELDQYNCLYFEEPGASVNPRFVRELKNNVKTPIATGERIGSVWGFQDMIENRAIDVAQPDLGVVGGITETKRVADFARVHDVGIQLHNIAGPILTMAGIHLETALSNFVIHEHIQWSSLDAFRALGKYDFLPENGKIVVPDRPGIGQELSDEAKALSVVTKLR